MHRPTPGAAVVIALVGALLAIALWRAWTRPILLDDQERPGAAIAADWPDMRIDVNRATAAELAVLPGVGPRLAERIVEDRERRGLFASLDDLQRVSGIGPATLERLRPYAVAQVAGGADPAGDR